MGDISLSRGPSKPILKTKNLDKEEHVLAFLV